jgi:hypothetical protein
VTSAGINLPLIMYSDLLGLPSPRPEGVNGFDEGLRWIHEERDVKTVVLYFLGRDGFGVRDWLASYRGRRTYAYAAWDDPGPILVSTGRVLGAAGRRLMRRLTGRKRSGKRPTSYLDLAHGANG